MKKIPKITSDFAILDVKTGRKALAKHFEKRPGTGHCPEELRIPVTITGFISGQNSRDDGVSIEFTIDVTSLSVGGK